MNHQISIKSIDGFCYAFSDSNLVSENNQPKEPHWNLPAHLGQGSFTSLKLFKGFHLHFCDYVLEKPCHFSVLCPKPAFGFGFCLSGKMSGKSIKMETPITTQSGDSQIIFHEQQTGEVQEQEKIRKRALTITIEPETFYFLTQQSMENFTNIFQKLIENNNTNYINNTKITPGMFHAVNQIFNCSYLGISRQLFIQSKALELIALRLEKVKIPRSEIKNQDFLNSKEIEKIYYAVQILTKDLENPPGLFELAQIVGLNHSKLNRGFHSLFNTSVFGYLRRIRLQEAQKLLADKSMNVTEAAYAVGYNSISSFSRAFQNQYGLSPKAFIRQI